MTGCCHRRAWPVSVHPFIDQIISVHIGEISEMRFSDFSKYGIIKK